MRVVVQRVSEASVLIDGIVHGSIQSGFLILLGIEHTDTEQDVSWLTKKIAGLRVMSDEQGKMNLSLKDIEGSCLVISQFTLYASTRKGNRPSFITAARPDHAIPLYQAFINSLADEGINVKTGQFGADMKVSLINDGPVTILIDSKQRE